MTRTDIITIGTLTFTGRPMQAAAKQVLRHG